MQIIVIGAGIVGLHVARLFGKRNDEVYVLDEAPYLAEHTSGRNSGVIHSGIFYKPGSFKEKVCIEGNLKTYEWVRKLNVPHSACGKWVLPEEGQEDQLEPFYEKIKKLPILKPSLVSEDELALREPALRKSRALFVPSTGIVDAADYVKKMALYLEEKGVQIILNCRVHEIDDQVVLTSRGEINYDLGINSAGLFGDEIAQKCGMSGYSIRPCRGDYYLLNRQPIKKPVYHLPYQGAYGLGVHSTPTLDGQTLLGPNAFFIEDKKDYRHQSSPEAYEKAVRFYLPQLKNFQIQQAYSGNRPKLYTNDQPINEFVIKKERNWIHLLGIESPGLTSSPVLAKEVMRLI